MKARPVGVTILAVLYVILALVALALPFHESPAWKADKIKVSFIEMTPGMVKVTCLILAVGLLVTAALFWKGMAPGLYLALFGLFIAIIFELGGGTYHYAVIDGIQIGYLVTVRDYFA